MTARFGLEASIDHPAGVSAATAIVAPPAITRNTAKALITKFLFIPAVRYANGRRGRRLASVSVGLVIGRRPGKPSGCRRQPHRGALDQHRTLEQAPRGAHQRGDRIRQAGAVLEPRLDLSGRMLEGER